ncbi:MAG: DUF2254 family protein [Leeuwenhoekiella sp.]
MKYLKRILHSIALVPSVLALSFLILAVVLLASEIDFEKVPFLNKICFTTKEDVQSVLAFLIGGIFTLTVFSYTMVMNVLNRNINNYSPRLIPMILGEKHHQLILGFTSGTIIYSMTLAMAINAEDLVYFPGIGAPLGIFFGIFCIILFIYFIHSVSRSIHINYIVKEAYIESLGILKKFQKREKILTYVDDFNTNDAKVIKSNQAGYLKMPSLKQVAHSCSKKDISLKLLKYPGTFVLKGEALLMVSGGKNINNNDLLKLFPIDHNVPMDAPETGFKHLVEIAVKAMSPAINDPGTAITALDYLTQLFLERSQLKKFNAYTLGKKRFFYFSIVPFDTLLEWSFKEMQCYLKDDPVLSVYLERSRTIIVENRIDTAEASMDLQKG